MTNNAMTRPLHTPFSIAGPDGIAMLILSAAVTMFTGGFSFLIALVHTYRVASGSRYDPEQPFSTLVTLGKRLDDGRIDDDYKLRLERAFVLYKNSEKSRILIVGGRRSDNALTEAQAGKDYLLGKGVLPEEITLEDKSLHTLENLQAVKKLVTSGQGEPPLFITNRYHLARCGQMAKGFGIRHVLCPAERRLVLNIATARNIVVEAFFIHWYIVGKLFSTATKNRKMLNRIS